MGDDLQKEIELFLNIIQDKIHCKLPSNAESVQQQTLFESTDMDTGQEDTIQQKVDFLDRMIQLSRIELRHLDNAIPMEHFLQGHIKFDNDTAIFCPPARIRPLGSGTRPIFFQPKLLKYLLFRHNEKEQVFDIIEGFIDTIWDSLQVVDFKRTATGVLRCFTNTRFAANTLREYGLLKFTKEEAYKTWRLSLPGFIVASKVIETKGWIVNSMQNQEGYALHAEIRAAFRELRSYEDFVKRLAKLCKPNTALFENFKAGLGRAYPVLEQYRMVIQNPELSNKARLEKCKNYISVIEEDESVQKFHDEAGIDPRAASNYPGQSAGIWLHF